ncbi:MAG: zinc ABC transporter substrate-binding protein [Clostridiales bacterium]|nr:zinc ABC transporter substrate-binding protein [Clostridiales bacterium]
MKNRIISMIISLILLTGLFAVSAPAETDRISVVTTIFPIYDWVREIVGEDDSVEITMLLNSGVDLHSFQPTAADIMKVATCDVFIYVGGESDEWVEDALKEAVNPDMKVISLVECMGDDIKMEENVEGMEHEHDHDHDEEEHENEEDHEHEEEEHEHEEEEHEHEEEEHEREEEEHEHEGEEHEHEHEEEADEHVWLSLRNAGKLTAAIAAALGETVPEAAATYTANCEAYAAKLDALDQAYAEAVRDAATDTVLFGDRFPFRYLTDDYGLAYYAAFSGCSAESEASFETIVFLAGKVDELGLSSVLTIEGDNHRIAETIIANTQAKDAAVRMMDSMQATTAEDVANGVTYLGVMEQNLEALRLALTK